MKVYDAIVTIRARISSVMNEDDERQGLEFEVLVRDLIESEGLVGVADDDVMNHPDIVSIVREERDA